MHKVHVAMHGAYVCCLLTRYTIPVGVCVVILPILTGREVSKLKSGWGGN